MASTCAGATPAQYVYANDGCLMKLNKFVVVIAVAFSLARISTTFAATDAVKVVASQGGVQLTLGDIDAFAATLPSGDRAPFFNSSKRIATLVASLLVQKQQAALARVQGLDKTMTGPVTDAALAKLETEHFRSLIQPPDFTELARERFMAEPEKYDIPAKLTVQRILVTSTARGDKEAEVRAEEVRQKALKDPAAFSALVDEYSDLASRRNDHGYIADVNRITDPAISGAIQALAKAGDISPVFKSADGYNVLKIVEKEPRRRQSFEDVRDSIIDALKAKYVSEAVANHIAEFSNKPVDADTSAMDSLRARYDNAAVNPSSTTPVPAKK